MEPLYLTTAIPFVNGAPHLGHALELVETDAIARHARLRGRPIRFLTGTDENAPKVAQAAAAAGVDVPEFVTANSNLFAVLAESLHVSYDDFIRTSTDPRHAPTVEAIWRACLASGDLYRAPYAGWYCAGCEQFVDGACDEHDAPPEWVEEENWYFRLSHYADRIRTLIRSGALRIVPDERANEVLAFLDTDVRDISVSRSRARARGWGIPVPDDPDQIIYVWFDALDQLRQCGAGRVVVRASRAAARDREGHRPVPRARSGPRSCCRRGVRCRPSCSCTTTSRRTAARSASRSAMPSTRSTSWGASASTRCVGGCCARCRASAKPTSPRHGSSSRRIGTWPTASATSCNGSPASGRDPNRARPRPRGFGCSTRSTRRSTPSTCAPRRVSSVPRSTRSTARSSTRSRGHCAVPPATAALAPLHATTSAIVDELAPFVPDLAALAADRLEGRRETAVFARLEATGVT